MFIENAKRGYNQLGYYLVGILTIIIMYFLGSIPLGALMIQSSQGGGITQEEIETLDFESMGIDLNLALFLSLLSFVFAMFGLWLAVSKMHNRPFITVITSAKKIDYKRIFFAAGLWVFLTVLAEMVMSFMSPSDYTLQFEPLKFIVLVLICLLVLPIQTSFEELFFRGYLMQGVGMAAGYRIVPLLITSVFFGLMHSFNPEVEKFGFAIMMVYYVGFGLAAGFYTLMDERTEIALGLHWANNFLGAVFVTFEGSALRTYAIFKVTELDPYLMLYTWIPITIIFTAVVASRYHWSHWKERLIGKGVNTEEAV